MEVWGAQGGKGGTKDGGAGGYSKGIIRISKGKQLFVYTGEQGKSITTSQMSNPTGANPKGSGGGATDIRVISGLYYDSDSLFSRIIVAGGGGGSGSGSNQGASAAGLGGYGGGSIAGNGARNAESMNTSSRYQFGLGANQISGGGFVDTAYTESDASTYRGAMSGSFGIGGDARFGYSSDDQFYTGGIWVYRSSWGAFNGGGTADRVDYESGGGGGGWYGGGSSSSSQYGGSGGGGSGWIYTEQTYSYWTANSIEGKSGKWKLDSGYYLLSASTVAGNTTFKSPSGTNETGHSGNGYARITYLGTSI